MAWALRSGRRLAEVRARRRSTSRWAGWGWTTSTSSTATGRPGHAGRGDDVCARPRRTTRQGALCRHLVVLARETKEAATIARDLGTPLLIHQPSYSMLNRWIEGDLLDELERAGHGLHRVLAARPGAAHRPLPRRRARRTRGPPARTRSSATGLDRATCCAVRALNEIAAGRGQKLAQLALAWALRDPRVTSALIGASSVEQLDANLDALDEPALRPTTSWPRSTSTPSSPRSTSGRSRRRPDNPRQRSSRRA